MDALGERLREVRTRLGWTLEALSERSGLSTGFLSQVERGLSTLSIVSLSAICRALDLPISEVFSVSGPLDREAARVTRGVEQLQIQIGDSPISYRYLSGQLPDAPIRELLIAEFPPRFLQENSTHEGREFGYVLQGRLTLLVDGGTEPLAPGDSYRLSASEPHGYRTGAGQGARVLMAVTQRFIELRSKGA
jgi:transcriptional regulator with XRE-family HTH domain